MAVICVYPWFWFLFFINVMLLYQIENNAIWLEFLICILLAYIVCKGWKNILGIWNWQTELLGRFFQLLAYLCSLTIPSGLSYWSVIFTLKKVFFFFFGLLEVFTFYSVYGMFLLCFQPFVDNDHFVHKYFLPQEYAILIPVFALAVLLCFLCVFVGYVMLKSKKKKA